MANLYQQKSDYLQHKVQTGETLLGIARQSDGGLKDVWRVAAAIYQKNQEAFESGNVNRLKSGSMLVMPTTSEVNAFSTTSAKHFLSQYAYDQASMSPIKVGMQPVYSSGDPKPQNGVVQTKHRPVPSPDAVELRVKPVGAVFSSPVDKDSTIKLSILANQRISHNGDNKDQVNVAGGIDAGVTVNLGSDTWVQGAARLAPGYNGKTGEYDPTVTLREATINHKLNPNVQVGAGVFRRPDEKYLDNFHFEPGSVDWPGNLATKNSLTQGVYAQYNDGSTYVAGAVSVGHADQQYRLYGDKVQPMRGAAVSGVAAHNWKMGEHSRVTGMVSGSLTEVPALGTASNLTAGVRYDHGDEKGNAQWGVSAGVFTQQDPTLNKGERVNGLNLGAQYNFNPNTSVVVSAAFDSTNSQHYGVELQRKVNLGFTDKATAYVSAMHDVDPTGRGSNTLLAGIKIPINWFGGGNNHPPSPTSSPSQGQARVESWRNPDLMSPQENVRAQQEWLRNHPIEQFQQEAIAVSNQANVSQGGYTK